MRLSRELAAHDRPAAAALPRAILGGATRAGVDAEARELVRLALEDKLSPRLDRLAVADLHALLNLAYVHVATAVGPVLADRMLSSRSARSRLGRGRRLLPAQAALTVPPAAADPVHVC